MNKIAVVGMSGRFPGAKDISTFWQNLIEGKETIAQFADEELELDVSDNESKQQGMKYINARGVLDDVDMFDAGFFGINPKEAAAMDPQHRLFLECAWEALEVAGYDPAQYTGAIGTFASASINSYLHANLFNDRQAVETFCGQYQNTVSNALSGNEKDFLPMRVAYKLDLKGPAYSVQSTCSSSLVAVCQAAQSLINGQCDMALAGGVSITFPQKRNYLYQEGSIVSADGHIRAFDAKAKGTVFGHGAGVVLLKRLDDAVKDQDPIVAVISGFAVNNDGSDKMSFSAPSLKGQEQVIKMAQQMAEVNPEQIGYVEAHGTGTPLGDPIEVAALSNAFRARGAKDNGYCAIGTCKPNIGHLDAAAGVCGLIKTVLAVHHGQLPPMINYHTANEDIDFDTSPFYPNTSLKEWDTTEHKRYAGVSSFGVGGTNAHVIIEDFESQQTPEVEEMEHLFVLSARNEKSLNGVTAKLGEHLQENPQTNLVDVAHTLLHGRRQFNKRCFFVAQNTNDLVTKLTSSQQENAIAKWPQLKDDAVCFMFPGQGAQRVNMGRGLYHSMPVFKQAIDRCAEILRQHVDFDLIEKLYPIEDNNEHQITDTALAQPAIFSVEYALATLWMSWGVKPGMVIGHSVGEYVAAVVSGALSLEDALYLVSQRARLMQTLPEGGMMSVHLSAATIAPMLPKEISIAAENTPELTVVAGPLEFLKVLQAQLEVQQVVTDYLVTSHAFHSSMMDPILDEFATKFVSIEFNCADIPWISTFKGDFITDGDIQQPSYWSQQLRQRVRFSEAIKCIDSLEHRVLLEVGPGQALTVLTRQQLNHPDNILCIPSLPSPSDWHGDKRSLLNAMGRLWSIGVDIDWDKFSLKLGGKRVALPTYAFNRKSHWIEPPKQVDRQIEQVNFQAEPVQVVAETTIVQAEKLPLDRRALLATTIKTLATNVTGIESDQIDPSLSLIELGFDSLVLTQFSVQMQKQLGIKLTFRQLLQKFDSLNALIDHVNEHLPQDLSNVSGLKELLEPQQQASADSIKLPVFKNGQLNGSEDITLEQLVAQQHQMLRAIESFRDRRTKDCGAAVTTAASGIRLNDKTRPKNNENGQKGVTMFQMMTRSKNIKALQSEQDVALKRLVDSYVAKTKGSKAHTEKYRSKFADPRTAAGFKHEWKEMVYPIVTNRSLGSKLTDIDGNEYIDMLMGFGLGFLGHSPKWVTEALHEQLDYGVEIGPQSPLAGEVAELLCELTNTERATFCNTGSEAVMTTLRLARTATAREKVVVFKGSYHGCFDEVLVNQVINDDKLRTVPIASGINQSMVENMIVLDYGTDESIEFIRQNATSLAAVLVEPVQSRNPSNQPRAFLHQVREITKKAGCALIFDEVITGFRCDIGGAQAWYGIEADMCTYGKILGGGMPIGALTGASQWMDHLDGGHWQFGDDSSPEVGVTFCAGTFVRHPLAMAAALKVLKFLKKQGPQLQENLNRKVAKFTKSLNDHFVDVKAPIKLHTFSSMFAIEYPPELEYMSLFWYYLRQSGIHIWEGFPVYFSIAHSDLDFERVHQAFKDAVALMRANGFIPQYEFAGDQVKQVLVSEAQQEIWLASKYSEESSAGFNETSSIYLDGQFDLDALKQAMQTVVDRHEALRCTFDSEGAHMLIKPHMNVDITVHDMTAISETQRVARFEQLKQAEGKRVLELVDRPPVVMQIVLLTADKSVLMFTAHHIIFDGWSHSVLFDEIGQLYSAYVKGQPNPLPVAEQISDFVEWEHELHASESYHQHKAFWQAQYQSVPKPLDFPFAKPRPQVKTSTASRETHILPDSLLDKLAKLGKSSGMTLFNIMLAGYQTLINRLSNAQDIVVGVPYAAQNSMAAKSLVGHCVNLLPVRVNVEEKLSFLDFAGRSADGFADLYEHRDYSFGSILKLVDIPRDPSRAPLIEVVFNMDVAMSATRFSGLSHKIELNPRHYFHLDMAFNVTNEQGSYRIDCDYYTGVFSKDDVQYMLQMFEALLTQVSESPSAAVADLLAEQLADNTKQIQVPDDLLAEKMFEWD